MVHVPGKNAEMLAGLSIPKDKIKEARKFIDELTKGKDVVVYYYKVDPQKPKSLFASVFVGGVCLNKSLLDKGLANPDALGARPPTFRASR